MVTIVDATWLMCLVLCVLFIIAEMEGGFNLAHDRWDSKETSFVSWWILKYDKVQHLLGGILLGFVFYDDKSYILNYRATILNVLWEIKDGLVSYKFAGKFGGDGFSYKDLTMTQTGIFIGSALRYYFFQ